MSAFDWIAVTVVAVVFIGIGVWACLDLSARERDGIPAGMVGDLVRQVGRNVEIRICEDGYRVVHDRRTRHVTDDWFEACAWAEGYAAGSRDTHVEMSHVAEAAEAWV